MTPSITPRCEIVLSHTSTSRSIKFRHTVLTVHATSPRCTAWGQGLPSHPWISFSSLTASHQIKHWQCTLPSLTSWIPGTALTYFKLECGLSSPASSQSMRRQFCLKWTCHMTLVSLPCLSTSFLEFVCVVAQGTRLVTWLSCPSHHKMFVPTQERNLHGLAAPQGGSSPGECTRVSCLKAASLPLDPSTCSQKASPVFCILHVFVNWVSGGMDSPSPMVTSSTNDMEGTLIFGLSKS